MKRTIRQCAGVLAMTCLAAIPALSAPGGASAATATAVDWPTYGFDSLRTGNNTAETALSPATVSKLKLAWAFSPAAYEATFDPSAPASNAMMFAEPVLATAVPINGTPVETLYVGDNNGDFYALDAHTSQAGGNVLWARSLGRVSMTTETGGQGLLGVRATAAFDRAANGGNGALFLGINGQMHAMSMTTGAELSGWPVALPGPGLPTDIGYVHDGVNIAKGFVYVGISAPFEQPPWYGRLVTINETTARVANVWYPLSGTATPPSTNATGGGIWGGGAVAIDTTATSGGGIYVATGNAVFKPNERMYSEYVVNLSPNLTKVIGYASPVLPTGDYDYGSNPVVFKPTGCPSKMLAVKNKSGLFVIESISSAGALSVTQTIQISNTVNMIGNAAWDAADQLLLVTTPAAGPAPFNHPGLYAFSPQSGCTQFNLAWSTQANIHGTAFPLGQLSSPTVANGVVYFSGSGTLPLLLAVAANSGPGYTAGQVLWQSPTSTSCLGAAPQTAPVVANGWVYQSCIGNNATVRAFSISGN